MIFEGIHHDHQKTFLVFEAKSNVAVLDFCAGSIGKQQNLGFKGEWFFTDFKLTGSIGTRFSARPQKILSGPNHSTVKMAVPDVPRGTVLKAVVKDALVTNIQKIVFR